MKLSNMMSNLGLKNVGLLVFVYREFLVIIFFTKKNYNSKKNPKKSFSQKNNFTERNLKNIVQKIRCTRVILLGAKKNLTIKIKIEGVA